jgi:hypothetical protein
MWSPKWLCPTDNISGTAMFFLFAYRSCQGNAQLPVQLCALFSSSQEHRRHIQLANCSGQQKAQTKTAPEGAVFYSR